MHCCLFLLLIALRVISAGESFTGKLDNGLSYFIQHSDEKANKISVRFAVRAGFLQEEVEERGAAHFIEHLVFRGTESFSEEAMTDFFLSLGLQIGGDINAFTSFLETVYQFDLYTDEMEPLHQVLRYIRNAVDALSFDEEAIERERGVILNEHFLRSGPRRRLIEKLWHLEYADQLGGKGYPFADERSILNISKETLQGFYKKWYTADKIGLIIVGDFDCRAVYHQIESLFSSVKRAQNPIKGIAASLPVFNNNQIQIFHDCEQTRSFLLMKHFYEREKGDEPDEARLVREVVLHLFRRRLQRVQQSSNAPFIETSAYCFSSFEPVLECLLTADYWHGESVSALQAILSELKALHDSGFSEEELLQGREYCRLFYRKASFSHQEALHYYLNCFLEKEAGFSVDSQFDLSSLTLEKLNRAVSHFLALNNWSITFMLSKQERKVPSQEKLQEVVRYCFEKKSVSCTNKQRPYKRYQPLQKGAIRLMRHYKRPDVYEYMLSNGIRVLYKKTAADCHIGALANYGIASLPQDEYDAAHFMNHYICYDLLRDLGVDTSEITLSHELRSNRRGLLYLCQRRHFTLALSMIYRLFSGQVGSDYAWYKVSRVLNEELVKRPLSSQESFFRYVERINDPSLIFSKRPNPCNISREKIEKVLRCCFSGVENFTFVIYGNIDIDELERGIETYLASIPTSKSSLDRPVFYLHQQKEQKEHLYYRLGHEKKSFTVVVFPLDFMQIKENKLYGLSFVSALIKHRLYRCLRQKMGVSYYVKTRLAFPFQPSSYMGRFMVELSCLPENVPYLLEEVDGVVQEMLEQGFSQTEIEQIQKQQMIVNNQQNNSALSQMYRILNTAHRKGDLTYLFEEKALLFPTTKEIKKGIELLLNRGYYRSISWVRAKSDSVASSQNTRSTSL